MATPIHVAYIASFPVNSAGVVVNKNAATVAQMMQTSSELRVIADPLIPNSATNPTPKAYLELEANDDFLVHHIDQTMIVTYLLL